MIAWVAGALPEASDAVKSIVPPLSGTLALPGAVAIEPICQSSSTIAPVPVAVPIPPVVASELASSGMSTGVCSVTVNDRSSSGVELEFVGTEMFGSVVSPVCTSNEPLFPSLVVHGTR